MTKNVGWDQLAFTMVRRTLEHFRSDAPGDDHPEGVRDVVERRGLVRGVNNRFERGLKFLWSHLGSSNARQMGRSSAFHN